MNFMAVVEGEVHTPALSGSMLEGVTRDSLIMLARHLGIVAKEPVMPADDLLGDIVKPHRPDAKRYHCRLFGKSRGQAIYALFAWH